MARIPALFCLPVLALAASGCAKDGDIDPTGGISVTRSACPAVGVPAHTGDITLFSPANARTADAIDVVAYLTNVRTSCNDAGAQVQATANFQVNATRRNGAGEREVILPYFATVVQGGRVVSSKSVSRIAVRFADGETRATTTGSATASIDRAAATLPEDVRERITRKRKAGDEDAAIDPMTDPAVREAVQRASFELLVGFQLSAEQLQYNATR